MFATLRGAIIEKRINLVKSVALGVPEQILGDRYRIEHVVANLISNAIKFSPEESVIEVQITLEEVVGEFLYSMKILAAKRKINLNYQHDETLDILI